MVYVWKSVFACFGRSLQWNDLVFGFLYIFFFFLDQGFGFPPPFVIYIVVVLCSYGFSFSKMELNTMVDSFQFFLSLSTEMFHIFSLIYIYWVLIIVEWITTINDVEVWILICRERGDEKIISMPSTIRLVKYF